mgnify:CR=1 FL=1
MGRKLLPVNAPVTFLLLVFLLAPAAMLQGNNILFWLLAVLAGILVVALVGSSWMLRGLELKRQLPLHGNVGEPLVIRYQVMRQRRWVPPFRGSPGATRALEVPYEDVTSAELVP